MNKKDIELLAPAGDIKTAIGAINAGADAVYLGAPFYSARAFAKNLSIDEIIYVIRYAHFNHAKVYLAMNTLMKNLELPKALELIEPLYVEGLDGIIVQDYGLLNVMRTAYPSMELHASTQMSVLSRKGAEWLKTKGVVRVVPGRELSLEELKAISDSGIEVECFIHGAMCYSYSGRCLMSSLAGGRSGNRGRCAGPCRKCYTTNTDRNSERKQGYFLSMKDMCALPVLKELKDAGVCSLKVEGRMKDPAYAAGVSEIYRKYLDGIENHQLTVNDKTELKEDMKKLASLYIRSSLQEGYYHKHNGADMITIASPAYQSMQEDLKENIYTKYIDFIFKQKISMVVSVFENCPITLTLQYKDRTVDILGETAQTAQKKALSEDDIRKQMDKLGDSFFEAEDIQVYTDENSFVPVKALNQLRRDGIAELENMLFAQRTDSRLVDTLSCLNQMDAGEKNIYRKDECLQNYGYEKLKVQVENCSQFFAAYELGIRRFILSADNLVIGDSFWKTLCSYKDCEYYYKLPDIVREKYYKNIKQQLYEVLNSTEVIFRALYCSSLDALSLAEEYVGRDRIIADHGLYVFNKQAEDFILNHTAIYTASYELNSKELKYFNHKDAREIIIYGRQDVMHSANCISKTLGHCNKYTDCKIMESHAKQPSDVNSCKTFTPDNSNIYTLLYDEQDRGFPVFARHKYCYNTTYNCEPLSLHSYVTPGENKLQASDYRLNFTTETPKQIQEVLTFYKKIFSGDDDMKPNYTYTTGHMKRGVD